MKFLSSMIFVSVTLAAAFAAQAQDAGDTQVLSPFAGSTMLLRDVRPGGMNTVVLAYGAAERDPGKTLQIEGSVERRLYVAPEGAGAYEVQKNYEQALKDASAVKLLACTQTDRCSSSVAALHKSYIDWALTMIPSSKSPDAANALNFSRDHYNHGLFKLIQNGATIYVSVLTAQGVPVAGKALRGRAVTVVDTIVQKVASTGKVSVMAADAMAKKLQDDDKAVLYGIFFDSGKSELKPESLPQIAEIAKMLRAEPLLKVFIVGHTDSEGVFEANLALSQRRAEAMVDALVKDHGIASARLTPRGLANLAPVGTNRNDGGRSKNRRVEVVVR